MASLQGTQINNTYPSLIKTVDNGASGATEKNLTDGEGNASTLSLGTASASFTGTLDLAGATVTGFTGGGLQVNPVYPTAIETTLTDTLQEQDLS